VVERRRLPVDVYALPPLLHNRPAGIPVAVERQATALLEHYPTVAVGYADCGTFGGLDEVCARLGLRRLSGLHCYDVFAGAETITGLLDEEPGTYLFTDFLVRAFDRLVVAELGLDRWPELRDDYFGHYRRVVWLTQQPDVELTTLAEQAAARLDLPLVTIRTGLGGLEAQLRAFVDGAESAEQLRAPVLGLGDLVEREQVQSVDPQLRVGERSRRGA
jgi:hypothetical protein